MSDSKHKWVDEQIPEIKDKTIVTLSMEGYIPELKGDAREANTRGGLGIYFGDKLEGLNAIGLDNAFGCMPLYKKRMIQSVQNGRQHIEYKEVSYENQPIERILDSSGNHMQFDVWGWDIKNTARDKKRTVQLYSIRRGGTLLYLFYCPEVFDILYADDRTHHGYGREHRFLQETLFAQCVYNLLKKLNIVPDVLHLNEGHVAGAAAIIRGDTAFDKTAIVYTNHTVVPAGMERFSVDNLTGGDLARARYAMRFPWPSHERFWRKFAVQHQERWFIDFSKGAIELCDVANGVSAEHASATQTLFPNYDRMIEPVLNGSGDSWIIDELLEATLEGKEPLKETLKQISSKGKAISLEEVKKRTAGMTDKNGKIISPGGVTLDPDLPTIWMVRRMVKYKSQLPILKDIIHVICADTDEQVDTIWGRMNGLKMQVVLGGIAPEGSNEEHWIEEFVSWMQRPDLKGRFVFVPNSDSELLRMKAIGADICINCPLPEQEACGTSDQRSARNGGINIAMRSGGPPEYIEDTRSGMLVGPYRDNDEFYSRAPKDILNKLRYLSEMYYNNNNGDSAWLNMKLESYLSSSKVTAMAMEQRYARLYPRAIRIRRNIVRYMNMEAYKAPHIKKLSQLRIKLHEAARDFLYFDPELKRWTVIAGSPYFDQRHGSQLYNWGRDTMISISGLCLERERPDVFREIMKNYLCFVKHGIIPNLVGDGSNPRYNCIDTSLWMFWAIRKYLDHTGDYAFLDERVIRRFPENIKVTIRELLHEIIETFKNGIQFEDRWQQDGQEKCQIIQISMDKDGLISAGNENTSLTWMDVRPKGEKPVTSRHGKAVEINSLWYNALTVMSDIARHDNSGNPGYRQLADKVKLSFTKFWNSQAGCLYDTIEGDPEQGSKIRPNQVFAVIFGLLDDNQNRSVISKIRRELLTPFGLRTLSPHDPDYCPVHNDDYSYHQGTVLPWLMGAFIDACISVYGKSKTLRILYGNGYFKALSETLDTLGSIPEVFDGRCDCVCKYGTGKGCQLQAWNVGETLRGLSQLIDGDDSTDRSRQETTGCKIVYEMVIRDYHDAKNETPGLVSALDELTFLSESGVEYIYLLGLMKHDGNPFDIIDPLDIDERAGSFSDLHTFIVKTHELGMKVIIDWLANQHVSKKSPLCKKFPDRFLYTDGKNGDYFINKEMKLCTGRELNEKNAQFTLVSATDEVPLRSFPRRWSTLAQPDLSHPEVRHFALEIGRFWLSKGLDGFRVDAALSTFPDKIKENWDLEVNDNLSYLFIQDMRKIKPDCFIMFEGFERQEELLQLADYENCTVYNWRLRNLATDAFKDKRRLEALVNYLKDLEYTQQIHNEMLNLGAEHDAFDFEDPWAKLDYNERLLLHFLYAFTPGYMLIFNGEVYGKQHLYKNKLEKTMPAPRVSDAGDIEKQTGKILFSLRMQYPQLIWGSYKFLENGHQDLIHIARFDEKTVVIGIINAGKDTKEVTLSLDEIIHVSKNDPDINQVLYKQDYLVYNGDSAGWTDGTSDDSTAEALLENGLHVEIAPGTCRIINLQLNA